MHTKSGVQEYVDAMKEIKNQGGKIAFGGKVCLSVYPSVILVDCDHIVQQIEKIGIWQDRFVPAWKLTWIIVFYDLEFSGGRQVGSP